MNEPTEDLSDPRHIYNVRARRAADTAERDMLRAIQREIDGPPQTVMGMIRRALESTNDTAEGAA